MVHGAATAQTSVIAHAFVCAAGNQKVGPPARQRLRKHVQQRFGPTMFASG